jgi:hypothetical protein
MIFLREYVCVVVPFTSIILTVLISRFVDRDTFVRFVGVVLLGHEVTREWLSPTRNLTTTYSHEKVMAYFITIDCNIVHTR